MSVIKGGDLMLFVGGKSIAYATSHTLTISADTKETSSKDSGGKWQTSEVGVLSWTCSSENLCGDTEAGIGFDELFEYMVARKPITGVFALEGDSTDYEDKFLFVAGYHDGKITVMKLAEDGSILGITDEIYRRRYGRDCWRNAVGEKSISKARSIQSVMPYKDVLCRQHGTLHRISCA